MGFTSFWEVKLCSEQNPYAGELQHRVVGCKRLHFGAAAELALRETSARLSEALTPTQLV